MNRRRITLKESQLKRMISESVRNVLSEGTVNNNINNQWNEIQEKIGAEEFLSAIYNWLSSDQIEELVDDIRRDYDMDYYDDDF